MGKPDRFMPLEIEPWTKKTARLSAAARGAYIDLLVAYWRGEELPANDDDALMRLARCTEKEWLVVWPKLRPYFDQEGDAYTQKRAKEEKAKAKQLYEQRASAGEAGGKASGKQRQSKTKAGDEANPKPDQQQTPQQNASENEHTSTLEHSPSGESPPVVPKGTGLPEGFVAWYAGEGVEDYDGYPHKVGRDAAVRAWVKREKDGTLPDLQTLTAATKRYVSLKPRDHAYANPSTWLNEARWLDQPAVAGIPTTDAAPSLRTGPNDVEWEAYYRGWLKFKQWPVSGYAGAPPDDLDCKLPNAIREMVDIDSIPVGMDKRNRATEAA